MYDELYTVVSYDKDNNVFVTYDFTIYKDKAISMAKECADMVENGELMWPGTDEGEPIDWISVYKGWATEDEEKIWTSYEEFGMNTTIVSTKDDITVTLKMEENE